MTNPQSSDVNEKKQILIKIATSLFDSKKVNKY